jgi:hypothetical protein
MEEKNIIFSQSEDCPECDTIIPDVEFDTGAKDEDGLTDLVAGELVTDVRCPECGAVWEATYEGWTNYGDA